jgi:SAM-dependent methyltransferase
VKAVANRLRSWLAHPMTRALDIDDPATTHRRRDLLLEKPFLRRIYEEWYETLRDSLPSGEGDVLELGSGAGFLSDYIPGLLTSDIFPCPGVQYVLDAHDLPFADGSLRGLVMTDVLHHLCRPRRFFAEAARCLRPGGVVAMIEPWVTPWSRLIYTRLHHEPFQPEADAWEFPLSGPLSGANGALPWILFERDRDVFAKEFPQWQIERVTPLMPFRYLVSGGVSLRTLTPSWTYGLWRGFERLLHPWRHRLGMFAHLVIRRL